VRSFLQVPKSMDFTAARLNMVESQLRTNRVVDTRLVEAMAAVPREAFLPAHLRAIAYVDEDIALGGGRYLMEPMVFARLVQSAQLAPGARVLLVGSGCGYGAAVLAHMGMHVTALECDAKLAAAARAACAANGAASVAAVEGPLEAGWQAAAPFDAILFEGGIGDLPPAFATQVGEGGRLLAVVALSDRFGPERQGKATLWQKFAGSLTARTLFDAATPLLPGMLREPGFVF
jgi:protein-L-isoaspartate(D-aspartate) O-methyltransferase